MPKAESRYGKPATPGWIFLGRAGDRYDAYVHPDSKRIGLWDGSARGRGDPTAYDIEYIRDIVRDGGYTHWETALRLMGDLFDDPSVSPNARVG